METGFHDLLLPYCCAFSLTQRMAGNTVPSLAGGPGLSEEGEGFGYCL